MQDDSDSWMSISDDKDEATAQGQGMDASALDRAISNRAHVEVRLQECRRRKEDLTRCFGYCF